MSLRLNQNDLVLVSNLPPRVNQNDLELVSNVCVSDMEAVPGVNPCPMVPLVCLAGPLGMVS